MNIASPSFAEGSSIPAKHTCDGGEISPELSWSDPPEGTVSFALVVEDTDVPTNFKPDGLWEHWLVWNMPPDTTGIVEGATPPGVVGNNSSGKSGYQGCCPPDKEHRYFFTVYALDAMLDIPQTAKKDDLDLAMENHILDKATLMGVYDRPQNQH